MALTLHDTLLGLMELADRIDHAIVHQPCEGEQKLKDVPSYDLLTRIEVCQTVASNAMTRLEAVAVKLGA